MSCVLVEVEHLHLFILPFFRCSSSKIARYKRPPFVNKTICPDPPSFQLFSLFSKMSEWIVFPERETERMTSFWSGLTEYHYLLRYKLIYMITARCKGQPITSGGRLHRLTAIFSYVSICSYTPLAEDVKCFNRQFQFICVGYASTSSVPLLKFFHDSSLIISLIQSRIGSWLGCQEKFPFPQLSLITSDSKCF